MEWPDLPWAITFTTKMVLARTSSWGEEDVSAGLRNACLSVKTFGGAPPATRTSSGNSGAWGLPRARKRSPGPQRVAVRSRPHLETSSENQSVGVSAPPSKGVSARPPWEMSFLLKQGGSSVSAPQPSTPVFRSCSQRTDFPRVSTFSRCGESREGHSDLLCSPVTLLSRCCQMLGCARLALGAPRTEGTAPARSWAAVRGCVDVAVHDPSQRHLPLKIRILWMDAKVVVTLDSKSPSCTPVLRKAPADGLFSQ